MQDTLLSLQHISKDFGEGDVLRDISLDVARGEFVTLLGASGCGKTTTLRIISGLETPDEGTVLLDGKDVTALPPERRPVNTVFQSYALFPHMNVEKNVAYGLRVRGENNKRVLDDKVEQALKGSALWDEVKDRLQDLASNLSGGQQQRLCIARALATDPELLLFDEPTSALDPIATGAIEELVHELKKRVTILIVTHNMQQAARVSDYTAYMYLGEMIEFGKTDEIFIKPNDKRTEDYITGRMG